MMKFYECELLGLGVPVAFIMLSLIQGHGFAQKVQIPPTAEAVKLMGGKRARITEPGAVATGRH
jgi:hypothetical protein